MDDKKTLTEEQLSQVRNILQEFFNILEIKGSFDLNQTDEGLEVILDTPDSGMVIGYHGEVLESLQLIASLILSQKLNQYLRVSIEVGDYKKSRSAYLEKLAQETKEKVLKDGREHILSSLRPWERRIIHLLLKDDKEVVTESMGEGKNRLLVIKPR